MTYCIASGCSYTDQNYRSPIEHVCTPVMWPAILEKKLNVKFFNVGRAGSSNVTIINNVYSCLIKQKTLPKSIYLLLTGLDRTAVLDYNLNYDLFLCQYYLSKFIDDGSVKIEDIKDPVIKKYAIEFHNDWRAQAAYVLTHQNYMHFFNELVDDTFRELYKLYLFCNSNKIELVIAQGVTLHQRKSQVDAVVDVLRASLNEFSEEFEIKIRKNEQKYNHADIVKRLMDNRYFGKIDSLVDDKKIKAYGFPFLHEMGGEHYDGYLGPKRHEYCLDKFDRHPNQEGQEIIADIMMGKIY